MTDFKEQIKACLQHQRDALVQKVEGLPERELRLPRTPTGTNLLGIVKHCLNVEHGYFGPTFGRTMDDPALLPLSAYEQDPQADWYATEDESAADLIALYRRVWAFCDETIDSGTLESPGRVPWWGERGEVTLGQVMVHVINDLARHAGQADILREHIDGATGFWGAGDNVPGDYDFPAYVERLTAIAERF